MFTEPARWVGRGSSTSCGTGWVIDTLLRGLADGTRRDVVVERVLFALVANRALAPSSKLAATSWIAHDVHLPGLTWPRCRYRADRITQTGGHIRLAKGIVAPADYDVRIQQRQTMKTTSRDGDDVGCPSRHVKLTVTIVTQPITMPSSCNAKL